ncbi:MAG: GreA/GreB family elongation factor [Verrucomicrobiota bacterium]
MSKAFTKEDDAVEETISRPQSSPLPPGVKNYLTRDGAQRMQDEWNRLIQIERPRVAALPDASEAKRETQLVDQRIAYLGQSLQSAEIVPHPSAPEDVVRFGATVKVRNRAGEQSQYRIVGIDETDLDENWVSWRSPIARALLNARLGQRVKFRFPAGEDELEIVGLSYE